MSTDFTPTNNKEAVPASPAPAPPGKKLSRRKVLALAGGGTLVLVVGGGVWRAADQGVFSTGQGQAMPAAVQMVEPETQHYFLTVLQNDYADCQLWHVQPEPAAQRQPVASAIPTLILAGEYDPATPPAYGQLAAQTLSKSYFFLFPGDGHGVVGRVSCATSMFHAFLANPDRPPDSTCLAEVGEPLFE
jgi:pimeloyl-ACP methyl ester carboxylesterase